MKTVEVIKGVEPFRSRKRGLSNRSENTKAALYIVALIIAIAMIKWGKL